MNDLEKQERMLDLLTEHATHGLNQEDRQELEEIIKIFPEWQDDETFALTTTAIALSAVDVSKEMPAHLKTKVLAESERFFANREDEHKVLNFKSKSEQSGSAETDVAGIYTDRSPKTSFWNWAGWAAAAAACIALAINLWTTRTPNAVVQNPPLQQNSPLPVPPSLAEQREQLLAAAPDAIRTSWTDINPKQPRNVKGDVVWSNSLQKGYIRFQNLPLNDKTKETYQLLIFDANQNAKTPIDGGVFDVDANGDVIVPINAKIQVQKPTMFAVTAEKPGGVVVSEQGKVMAVAKVET